MSQDQLSIPQLAVSHWYTCTHILGWSDKALFLKISKTVTLLLNAYQVYLLQLNSKKLSSLCVFVTGTLKLILLLLKICKYYPLTSKNNRKERKLEI